MRTQSAITEVYTSIGNNANVIGSNISTKGELHEQAKLTFSVLQTSKLEAIIPHPILA